MLLPFWDCSGGQIYAYMHPGLGIENKSGKSHMTDTLQPGLKCYLS